MQCIWRPFDKKKQQNKKAAEPTEKICTIIRNSIPFQANASEVDSAGGMAFKQNGLFDVSFINTQLQTCSFLPAVHYSIWWYIKTNKTQGAK